MNAIFEATSRHRETRDSYPITHTVITVGTVRWRADNMPRSEHNHLALPRRDYMNTNAAARVPDWKNLYQLAVMEPDPAKLSQRIVDARSVILDRIQETLTTSSHYSERQ